ncbi:MAG: threonine--tRNA ligase [Planctomycetota bacterium]|jgi:threonyl-tRNA synthetase
MSLSLVFPDGSEHSYEEGASPRDVLSDLSGADSALALIVDGEYQDLHTPLRRSGRVRPVLPRSEEGLEVLRHTAAHVMAQAVARLWGKDKVEFAIGPVIQDGFYYDFDVDEPFKPEDLPRIEEEMRKIVAEDLPLSRVEMSGKDKAQSALNEAGRATFKKEIVDDLPDDSVFSFYSQGEFTDLCRGPHVTSTAVVGNDFKLLSVAGAYWRGSEKNKMLQRIYATAFFDDKALEEYLHLREEAKKRDHRVLGRELGLFKFPEASPGSPIWLPNGMIAFRALEQMIRDKLDERRYVEIRTPVLLDSSVWKVTGHLDHYKENMFFLQEQDDRLYGLKPMNCPGSAMAFQEGIRSYRELPLRLAEFGFCHRNEKSGVLGGLTRVRSFTQDDAHVYCTPDQLESELDDLVAFVQEVYAVLGFEHVTMDFATRPASSTGSDEMWENAEAAIKSVLERSGEPFRIEPGDGAFYGPKIDFKVTDSIKREWQLATIQVDFSLPDKFDLEYTAQDGTRQRPVVIHRAILGSFERMFGILIEHFAGAFPLWLAPEQVRVVPISEEKQGDACRAAVAALREAGVRATADLASGKMGAKIREAVMAKVPYVFVIGNREAESGAVAVRRRDGHDLGAIPLVDAVEAIAGEAKARSREPALGPPLGTPLPERKKKR